MWHPFLNPNFSTNEKKFIAKSAELKSQKSTFQKSLEGIQKNN
jgi:hypothetical protein